MPKHRPVPSPKSIALGARIAEARGKLDLSQEEIALRLGVSKGAVGQYEIGYTTPRWPKMQRLADILGVTVEWLLTGDDPEEKIRAQTVTEQSALHLMRAIPADKQSAALAMLQGLAGIPSKK